MPLALRPRVYEPRLELEGSLDRFRDPLNPLYELARRGSRLTRWYLIPVLLFIFLLAGSGALFFSLESAVEAGLWDSALDTAAYLIVANLPVTILIGIWLWRWERRDPRTVGLQRSSALRFLLSGFAFGAGLIVVGVVLLVTGGEMTLDFDQTSIQGWSAAGPASIVLLAWVVQGFTEEIIFRGWLLQNTAVQLGPVVGVIVATLIFGLAHLTNPGVTALAALNLVLIGVLFTLIALLEGGIWAASGFHIAWNWAQSNVFGFKVSGLDIGGGSLVGVAPGDSDAIVGGEFGFEGSVAATTTIVIGILIVIAVTSRYVAPSNVSQAGRIPGPE
jgi:membrane protease YdiL (CAAX protease family)